MKYHKLIFGLGNPGSEYQFSRHNAGFMFLDYLQSELNLPVFAFNKKVLSEVSSGVSNTISQGNQLLLVKPQTMMNLSGEAVTKTLSYLGNLNFDGSKFDELNQIYVAHDDLDIPIGEYKIQQGVGPKQHNGLLSIYQHLQLQNFWHIRLGVDDRNGDRSMPAENYVLQKLPPEQKAKLKSVFIKITQQIFGVS